MPGGYEWLIIIGVLLLLFGAKKLPDMARSVGQSARVFKGEMKGLKEDARTADPRDDLKAEPTTPAQVTPSQTVTPPAAAPATTPPATPAAQPQNRPVGDDPAPAQHDRTDVR